MTDWAHLEVIDDDSEYSSDSSECDEKCYYCDELLNYDEGIYEDDEAVDRYYCENCWLFIQEK